MFSRNASPVADPAKRNVFGPYNSGDSVMYADPLAVLRAITLSLDGDPNATLQASREGPARARLSAQEALVPAVRKAFDMAPFDPATGGGATDELCLSVLDKFLEYLSKKG